MIKKLRPAPLPVAPRSTERRPRQSHGRYDNIANARVPVQTGHARSPNVEVGLAAVPDPYDPSSRLLAPVNRRVDVLEDELSRGRISVAAHAIGRRCQYVFEKAKGPGGSNWQGGGDRVGAFTQAENAFIRAMEDAREIRAYCDAIRMQLGEIDARLITFILRDRMSFAEVATLRGRAGERGTNYFAQRFRDALETLAERWAARGADRPRTNY